MIRTNIGVTGLLLLELGPVDTRIRPILLEDLQNIGIDNLRRLLVGGLASSIVLVALDSRLDALVVEVGVVLLLELAQDILQLVDPVLQVVALIQHLVQGIPQLIDALLGQTNQNAELAAALALLLDHLASLRPFHLVVLALQLHLLLFKSGNLLLKSSNLALHPPAQLARLLDERPPPLGAALLALPPLLLQTAVLLPDGRAAVLALGAADVQGLVGAVAAQLVVAHAVVDVHEGDVGADVTLVLTPETRKGARGVGGARHGTGQGLLGREGVQVRAC